MRNQAPKERIAFAWREGRQWSGIACSYFRPMSALKDSFGELLQRHEVLPEVVAMLWQEVVAAHSTSGRHYHTLAHLEDLHEKLSEEKASIEDYDAVLLAIVYHDFIYRVSRKDNEVRSAEVMRERMLGTLGLPGPLVERAALHIRATQRHEATGDRDTDLFIDADLSILGSSPDRYGRYAQQVRREFRLYPDLLYKPGRRKVLAHFLALPHMFKTAQFRERFEVQARINLEAELGGLS
jgi:predicted metal-dependent HD superfamily phosphohydrolase